MICIIMICIIIIMELTNHLTFGHYLRFLSASAEAPTDVVTPAMELLIEVDFKKQAEVPLALQLHHRTFVLWETSGFSVYGEGASHFLVLSLVLVRKKKHPKVTVDNTDYAEWTYVTLHDLRIEMTRQQQKNNRGG